MDNNPATSHIRRFLTGVCILTLTINACAIGATTLVVQSPPKSATNPAQIAGVPILPDIVTVIPFYWKENETALEKTKVVIPAEVDGIHGIFILDTGDYDVDLNRTFLQPNSKGGVDSITDANRIPEHGWDTVGVKLRIGTLTVNLDTPEFGRNNPRPGKVVLDHAFGNFSWAFAPRLGNIGVPGMEPFEMIIDYLHQRVILIRLDSAGHRLTDVPAYTPNAIVPLVKMKDQVHWGLHANIGNVTDTLLLDTGNPGDAAELKAADQFKQAISTGHMPFEIDRPYISELGFPFLHRLGVVGFNFRARQFILYKEQSDTTPPGSPQTTGHSS